jgi:hypothetical protein
MPITPLHMGPGLAVKAVLGRRFSLMVFGFSQVAIDIEPLIVIMRDDDVLHGFTHTYIGATLIALVSVVIGRPICQYLLRFWKPDPKSVVLSWWGTPGRISWTAAIVGAFIGAYSHVFLDSIMHYDMHPWAPWSEVNKLLHVISVENLHLLCLLSGVLGIILIVVVKVLRQSGGREQV